MSETHTHTLVANMESARILKSCWKSGSNASSSLLLEVKIIDSLARFQPLSQYARSSTLSLLHLAYLSQVAKRKHTNSTRNSIHIHTHTSDLSYTISTMEF